MRLILASASPRRAELLAAAGFEFEIRATDVDERVIEGESPRAYVRRLAIEKSARALELVGVPVAGLHGASHGRMAEERTEPATVDVLTIGADTAVIVDDEILGKPTDEADAERMLRLLSGRAHVVMTGVSIRGGTAQLDAVEETLVHMRPLTEAEIAWYVRSAEGTDKAGGYAIQGLASRFIPRVEGSYSNVVGLPIARVADLILEFG